METVYNATLVDQSQSEESNLRDIIRALPRDHGVVRLTNWSPNVFVAITPALVHIPVQSQGDFSREVISMIVNFLVSDDAIESIILMSMVNRAFYKEIIYNFDLWFKLFMKKRQRFLPNNVYQIRQIPLNLFPEHFMNSVENYERARRHYRRIVILSHIRRCSKCGKKTHQFKNFYSMGLHLCDMCVRENFVSQRVLYEKYGLMLISKISTSNFAARVLGKAYWVTTRMSSAERMEWSYEQLDRTGPKQTMFFFWRPHLERIFNLPRRERQYKRRFMAAQVIKAVVRRCVVQQIKSALWAPSKRDNRQFMHYVLQRYWESKACPFPDYVSKPKSRQNSRWMTNLITYQNWETPPRDVIPP